MAKTKIENAWLGFGIIGILVFGGFVGWIISNNSDGGSSVCASEFEHITTGIAMNYNQKCCSGLEAKSPEGFTGGAWCLSGRYDAKCLIPTSTNGINTQGTYAVERVQSGGERILLKAGYCDVRCGGIGGIQCPTNYNCELDNPTIADSMGTCRPPHI